MPMRHALLFSVFVIASCGLAYELIAGALSSYLLGDSVTQFSTVIGAYLFAMGVGSWLSKYITRDLIGRFIQIELMVGLLGGFSAVGLFLAFVWLPAPFRLLLYLAVFGVGVLVGLEIPLVMRILKRELAFKDLVSQVLTFDYLGALAVSILFPLLLAPQLGMVRTGLLFGLLNVAVALWALHLFRDQLPARRWLAVQTWAAFGALAAGFAGAGQLTTLAEAHLYADEIVHAETTPYQRIVVTRWRDDLRLFLNNNLQFSSHDEYRYHEALVHPGLAALPAAKRALVLGGGDGLALREILKYPERRSGDAGRSRSGDDRVVRHGAAAGGAQRRGAEVAAGHGGQCRRPAVAGGKPGAISTSSSSTSPIPPISPSASSTPRPSTVCWKSAWRRAA